MRERKGVRTTFMQAGPIIGQQNEFEGFEGSYFTLAVCPAATR